MKGEAIKNIFLAVVASIGGIISQVCGGWDTLLKCLVVFMLADYLTGIAVALIFHKSRKTKSGCASSKEGFKGIIKKICMLMVVALAVCIDTLSKTDYIRSVTILFFIGNEGLSICENLGLMGIKYPEFLHRALEVMREENDKGDKNEI